jgi:hypothetical protein
MKELLQEEYIRQVSNQSIAERDEVEKRKPPCRTLFVNAFVQNAVA